MISGSKKYSNFNGFVHQTIILRFYNDPACPFDILFKFNFARKHQNINIFILDVQIFTKGFLVAKFDSMPILY